MILDQWGTLARQERAADLEELMRDHGVTFEFLGDADERHAMVLRAATEPFVCGSPWLAGRELRRFQHVGMMVAYQAQSTMLEWDTGTGKTVAGALLIQRLLEEGVIDRAVVFCRRNSLKRWETFLREATTFEVVRPDGQRKKRQEIYANGARILVANHEKARYPKEQKDGELDFSRTDIAPLIGFVEGQRVLFVVDEVQRIKSTGTLASRGVRALKRFCSEWRTMGLTATPHVVGMGDLHGEWENPRPGVPPRRGRVQRRVRPAVALHRVRAHGGVGPDEGGDPRPAPVAAHPRRIEVRPRDR